MEPIVTNLIPVQDAWLSLCTTPAGLALLVLSHGIEAQIWQVPLHGQARHDHRVGTAHDHLISDVVEGGGVDRWIAHDTAREKLCELFPTEPISWNAPRGFIDAAARLPASTDLVLVTHHGDLLRTGVTSQPRKLGHINVPNAFKLDSRFSLAAKADGTVLFAGAQLIISVRTSPSTTTQEWLVGEDSKSGHLDGPQSTHIDGPVAHARFSHIVDIHWSDEHDALFVSDSGLSAVRMVKDGQVSTVARGVVRCNQLVCMRSALYVLTRNLDGHRVVRVTLPPFPSSALRRRLEAVMLRGL